LPSRHQQRRHPIHRVLLAVSPRSASACATAGSTPERTHTDVIIHLLHHTIAVATSTATCPPPHALQRKGAESETAHTSGNTTGKNSGNKNGKNGNKLNRTLHRCSWLGHGRRQEQAARDQPQNRPHHRQKWQCRSHVQLSQYSRKQCFRPSFRQQNGNDFGHICGHRSPPDPSPRRRTSWCRQAPPGAASTARPTAAISAATIAATSPATSPATTVAARPLPLEGRGQGVRSTTTAATPTGSSPLPSPRRGTLRRAAPSGVVSTAGHQIGHITGHQIGQKTATAPDGLP
jgi:hypothetical protein